MAYRPTRYPAARLASALGVAVMVFATGSARAQVPPPDPTPVGTAVPIRPAAPPTTGDLGASLAKMADEMRRLGDDIATDLARSPAGPGAAQDARELAQGLDELRADPSAASAFGAKRGYSALHSGWQGLRASLARSGGSPVVDRDAQRVAALDDQIAGAVGLNALPNDYYAANPPGVAVAPPSPISGTRRLARALVDRAEALAEVIQIDMAADPTSPQLIADATTLASTADAYYDALKPETDPALAAQTFANVDALADRVERRVAGRAVPPRVASAWQAFASAEALMHRQLGVASTQPVVSIRVPGLNLVAGGVDPLPAPSTVAILADRLNVQVGEFLRVFGPGARNVPEGPLMLDDARRLAAASAAFRDAVARGADANGLALAFRDVDIVASRLSRRVSRVARGRFGPNILQVGKIGETCEQLHRALGLPGFAPQFGAY